METVKVCRFCEEPLNDTNIAPKDFTLKKGLDNVCNARECLEKRRWSCDLIHECGHNCIGLMGHECLPCLNPKCLSENNELKHSDIPTENDKCKICNTDSLKSSMTVSLNSCGHYFHFFCLWQKIDKKWVADRITFEFLECIICQKEILVKLLL